MTWSQKGAPKYGLSCFLGLGGVATGIQSKYGLFWASSTFGGYIFGHVPFPLSVQARLKFKGTEKLGGVIVPAEAPPGLVDSSLVQSRTGLCPVLPQVNFAEYAGVMHRFDVKPGGVPAKAGVELVVRNLLGARPVLSVAEILVPTSR